MPNMGAMPGPCLLCGSIKGLRQADGWHCGICGWRVGDVPDPELPRPRVDVVYYIRYDDRVKIGTSADPRQRLRALWHQELLAFERGGRELERQRHNQFAELREGGEWFRADPLLLRHALSIRAGVDPWHAYARWIAEAYGG